MLLTLVLITIVIFNNTNSNESNIISNTNKDKQVINNNMITMMYETEAGSGEYIETKDISWPESGYIFNDTLSGCENGGELEYNSINNTVNLLSNSSDRCYVYFDKYDGVWIDNVVATNITGNSITLDVSATSENGNITTYYYALNDSEEYIEVGSNVITIDDLNKLTEYKISIYCLDNTNAKSNIYELTVSTTDISVPVINSVSVSNITTNGFTLTVDATSNIEIEKYYFIIDSEGESQAGASTTNSFTFNTLDDGISYNILVFVENVNGYYSNKYNLNATTEEMITLAKYVINQYNNIQGNNGIYYHTSSLANSAADNSYRYAGASDEVNNYVCFGSDAKTCPSDNLYRIIGVFGSEIKLIKNTSIGEFVWSNRTDNLWNSSIKPDIRNTLNKKFLNSISLNWQNKIAKHEYEIGGMEHDYSATVREYYDVEVGSNSRNSTDSMKIGLMYVSDFGYAATPSYWTIALYNYESSKNSNWLSGITEWTISNDNYNAYNVFNVISTGIVSYIHISASGRSVRPCFYLNSDVTYVSGTGTQSDPFRIQ